MTTYVMGVSDLRQEIDKIVNKINTDAQYHPLLTETCMEALTAEASIHSYNLESDLAHSDEGTKEGITRLRQAWDYLSENQISLSVMSGLGGKVSPKTENNGMFRSEHRRFGPFTAPSPEKVPYLMQNYVDFMESTELHSLYRSLQAHTDLIRIHPYNDGNGRSARLMQNFTLRQRDIRLHVYPRVSETNTSRY